MNIKISKAWFFIILCATLMAGWSFLLEENQQKAPVKMSKPEIIKQQKESNHSLETFLNNNTEKINFINRVKSPEELSDSEIRLLRDQLDHQYGGAYYYHTPGRHVESMDEIVERKLKEKDWALRNVK